MRWTRALKNAGALIAAGSLDMFALRWFATFDTPARWARLQAEQRYAYAHGQSMCVYDSLPFLHYPSVRAFFVGPFASCLIIALFIVGWVVWGFAQRMERRADKQQVAHVRGGEVDG
jgi:hypothetical protein